MHILPSMTSTRQRLGGFLLALASAFLVLAAGSALIAPAGAQDGCGTYSYGFPGTRLLNDGISNSAGPYAIDLPAGTYTVTLASHDHHSRQVDIAPQLGEQYHVVLNSGYISPASNDVPEDADFMTTIFPGQVIAASTGISVIHAGAPGINSVDVLCVGFTPEPVAPVDDDTASDRDLPEVDEEPSIQAPPDSAPGDEANVPDPADDADVPVDVLPVVETPADDDATIEGPDQDLNDSVDTSRTPLTPPDAVEAEVKAQVEFPAAPQLAVTGFGSDSLILFLAGLSLIMLGAVLVRSEKQLA